MNKGKINIVIADDHTIFLEGLSALLNNSNAINVVASVSNGQEVLDVLKSTDADVVLTDIDMPVMDGMRLTKELRKNHPLIKILALTMHNEGRVIKSLIKAGVTGYILKDTGKDELINAIRTVADGENYFSDEVKANLVESMIPGKRAHASTALIQLSDRESEVLKLIATELTQVEIAEKLFISEHTVIFHKRKLFAKFNVKNTAGLIKCAIEQGFLN